MKPALVLSSGMSPSRPGSTSTSATEPRSSGKRAGKSGFRPYKARRYGTPKELVSRAADGAGGIRALAELIGVKVSQAAAYTDPACPGKEMKLEQAHRLALARPDLICFAEHFAALAGGVFSGLDPSEQSLTELMSREEADHGRLLSRFIEVREGAPVSVAERASLLPDLDATITALVEARAKLMGGRS